MQGLWYSSPNPVRVESESIMHRVTLKKKIFEYSSWKSNSTKNKQTKSLHVLLLVCMHILSHIYTHKGSSEMWF